jgi:hypothetical protein
LGVVTDWAVLNSAGRLPNLTLPEQDPEIHRSSKNARTLDHQAIRLCLDKQMGPEMTFPCLFHQPKTQACVHNAFIEIREAFQMDSLSF